jgi:hypothetical protein
MIMSAAELAEKQQTRDVAPRFARPIFELAFLSPNG